MLNVFILQNCFTSSVVKRSMCIQNRIIIFSFDYLSSLDYIVIISVSAFVIICMIVIITYRKCKRKRRQQSLETIELGSRYGELPRHSVSSEETVFDLQTKRD